MKLQAQVIMNLALGLSVGLGGTACQKTGQTSEEAAQQSQDEGVLVQPDWSYVLHGSVSAADSTKEPLPVEPMAEPVAKPMPTPVAHEDIEFEDRCPACGMG